MKTIHAILGLAVLAAMPIVASATTALGTTVVWGPATPIVGDTDVMNTGTTVAAVNFGPDAVTDTAVNGVTFTAFPVPSHSPFDQSVTIGNVTADETQTVLIGNSLGTASSTSPPFSKLTTSYQNLLGNYITSGVIEDIQVTVNGLSPGTEYLAQIWSNYSATSNDNATDISGGPSLVDDVTGLAGGTGEYATGLFAAGSASQTFTLSGDPSGNIDGAGAFPIVTAFQLRAVPEPTTLASLTVVGGLFACRRRRHA